MKPIKRFAHLVLVCLALAVPAFLHAQDISIRPKSPAGNTPGTPPNTLQGGVNYGITATPKSAPPAPQPATQPQAKPATPPPPSPPPDQASRAPAPAPHIPPPQPHTPPRTGGTAEIVRIDETNLPMPTGSGSRVFNITLQPSALSGTDIDMLRNSLGLQDQDIKANCFFEHDVLLMFTNDSTLLSLKGANSAQYRHEGAIADVSLYPTIACRMVKPPVSGVIIQQGNFYKLSVTGLTCPKPPATAQSVTLRYTGDGKGDCQFR